MSDVLGTPQHHRARRAVAIRNGREDDAQRAARDLRAANPAKHIKEVVDAAPPLTDAQRMVLAALLINGNREENR
jgi:hypothetical protein